MFKLRSLIAATITAISLTLIAASPAQAEEPTCQGASCEGKSPTGTTCEKDAVTVKEWDVNGDGMLALRHSEACKANWGRFSSYWRTDLTNAGGTAISHARITAWNPNESDYGSGGQTHNAFGNSWWTKMVDGTKKACTGVELIAQDGKSPGGMYNDQQSLGWFWGPCG